MICYHFCDKEFLNELKKEEEIIPKPNITNVDNRANGYNYLFNKLNCDALFFSWKDKENKGNEIKIDKNGEYVLLKLDVPDKECILTNYYNWCDIIYCLEDGSIEEAERIVKEEFGCTKGFDFIFNEIFNLEDGYGIIQVLLKKLKYSWIKDIIYVKEKII